MRIAVLGATGMVGGRVVTEAASRGHAVVAGSRAPTPDPRAEVTACAVDLADGLGLDGATADADAIVLAVRPAPGHETDIAEWTERVLTAATATGGRVLVVGGAAPLRSPNRPGLLVVDDAAFVPPQWREVARASIAQLDVCLRHPQAPWAYLSPSAVLEPGTRTGEYRRGATTLLVGPDGTSRISAEDLAVAVIDELEQPSQERHFTVASALCLRGTHDDGSR